MADTVQMQATAPIIPVIDERIDYLPTAPNDYKLKVQKYNDLLEDIYEREVELNNIKLTLIDMREVIAQETRILQGQTTSQDQSGAGAGTGILEGAAARSDSSDSEDVFSDANSDKAVSKAPADPIKVKAARKAKAKSKGYKRSKATDGKLDGEWDYNLEFSDRKGRRASDASIPDVEDTMV